MKGFRRNVSQVAIWTMLSRVLGLLRDVLLFATLGTGMVSSAFILAFTLPNLFRRLLGEGALTSSTIPVMSACREHGGKESMFELLNGILGRLGVTLLVIQMIAVPLFIVFEEMMHVHPRWFAAAQLSQKLFPYMLFICLGALICGALNVLGRFTVAALNQIWLNLLMIIAAVVGMVLFPDDIWIRVYLFCGAVLLGGALQLLVPAGALARDGWRPREMFFAHPEIPHVMRLFWPGLLGAAIMQINILVVRFLAFSIDDRATGLLYIASRLVELPLGVFAIAITTVIFPELSRLSAIRRDSEFAEVFGRGLSVIFMIMLPATLGLIVLANPILSLLFEWGLFKSSDVQAATPVLQMAVLGLPFFAWSTLLTRAWYARQQMRVPVILAAVNLLLNLMFGLVLMQYYGAVGLALANTLSAMVHCIALQVLLPGKALSAFRLQTVFSLGMGLGALGCLLFGGRSLMAMAELAPRLSDLISVVLLIPLGAAGYFAVLWLSGHGQLRALMSRVAGAPQTGNHTDPH